MGTVGLIGSDDVLACFIAGNAFTWDDWFRLATEDDTLQPSIDMLLNVSIFLWFGAVCPWPLFADNDVVPISRLVALGILVLLLRRPPIVALLHTRIYQIEHWRQMTIVGFFGPIGVSAIFYLYISLEYLHKHSAADTDLTHLAKVMMVVVWFLVICSIVRRPSSGPWPIIISLQWQVVHGLTIPIAKIGIALPRTLSVPVATPRDGDGHSLDNGVETPARIA